MIQFAVRSLSRYARREEAALRVLIVDDQAVQVHVLAALLRRWGFEVYECTDSPNCMEMIERLRPEVVLLDLVMPQMTGFDIADEIRLNPDLRPLRLIAVTALGTAEDREKTLVHGFDYHLVKPVEPQQLQAVLRQIELGNASSSMGRSGCVTEQPFPPDGRARKRW